MYCVLNMGYTPSQYINLSQKERAFVIASVKIKVEEEKKQERKIRNSRGRRK